MDYKIVECYLDCPHKAFLALSKKEYNYSLETIFRYSSEKSIQNFLSDKENVLGKLNINKSVTVFEKCLKHENIIGVTHDLLLRRFIANLKDLHNKIDYEVINSVPCSLLTIDIPNTDKVEIQLLGYHLLNRDGKESYRFFIYEPNIKHDKIENFLRVKLIIHALKNDPSIKTDLLKNSVITLLDFYNSDVKDVHINRLADITSVAHLESVLMGIKLGIAYPSPKPYHCERCEYKKVCIYTCDSKAALTLTDEFDILKRKYKQIKTPPYDS